MSMSDGYGDVTNIYQLPIPDDVPPPQEESNPGPAYRVYPGSRVAIGKAVGETWQRIKEAAVKAYEQERLIWDETLRYYNNNQSRAQGTVRGLFVRGDGTENVIYSNLNVMLPAVYSKDPDIACSTGDKEDEPFSKTLQAVLNTLFRRKDKLHAKPKIKKAAGMALLTNYGVLKMEYVGKDDSMEIANRQMEQITAELSVCKDQEKCEEYYGQLAALEKRMALNTESGPQLNNVLPHMHIIDPNAELPGGTDAKWQIEGLFIQTEELIAGYTIENPDGDEQDKSRMYLYKPTHQAVFAGSEGQRADGLGLVMKAIEGGDALFSHTTDERQAYLQQYYTECYLVWDKLTRRIMLFHRDDWKWPLWVWDEEIKTTRFFPYYIIGYGMSTGGTVTVGESAYYLDQQDEINEMNKQMARIRRAVFNFFFFNSAKADRKEVEKFVKALRGIGTPSDSDYLVGVDAGDEKITDMIQAVAPPSNNAVFEKLFDKKDKLDSINRISNTSDALRGVQFKTNTNEAAVDTYHESMRLSVGAKVDVIEDVLEDMALTLAEMCVQTLTEEDVEDLVGAELAKEWRQMSLEEFRANYSIRIVAGSMEKPNSIFKKKEAIQLAQSLGQFAQAAPGAVLTIVLKLMEQAFTDVNIKPEDWALMKQEVAASMSKGATDPAAAAPAGNGPDLREAAMNLPPEVKQKVVAMSRQGVPQEQIAAFIMQNVQGQQQ